MDEGGSMDEVSLSLKRLCGGGLGGAPSLVTLEGFWMLASLSVVAPLLLGEPAWGGLKCRGL